MRAYNFAIVVSVKNNIPIATHLPFVIEERENELVLDFAFKQSKRTT